MLVFLDLNLSVIAAYLAVITLGIQLCVHDVVVDKLHDGQNSLQVILHVRNLHIGDSSARRQCLELGFQRQLVKGVDLLGHMYVIAVRNVVAIRYTLYDTETLLQTFGKLVGGAFQRSTVQGVVDIFSCFPFGRVLVELLHNLQAQLLAFRLCELLAVQAVYALPEACVAQRQGGVTAVEIFINGLAFFQTEQRAVLPQNRSRVGNGAA